MFFLHPCRYRLDLTVNSPLDKVVSALQDQSYQKDNWDPDVKEYVIEELGEVKSLPGGVLREEWFRRVGLLWVAF